MGHLGRGSSLHEEIVFDRDRVTSLDWARYAILRFDEVPTIELETCSLRCSIA